MSDYKTPMTGESMYEALKRIVELENKRIQEIEEILKKWEGKIKNRNGK